MKPELELRHHLEIVYCVITLLRMALFWRKLVTWCTIASRLLWSGQNCKAKKNSNIADACFSKPEVVISQPLRYVDEI